MAVVTLGRAFSYNGRELPDPNPELSVNEVMTHYQGLYPKLIGGKVIPAVLEGDVERFELKPTVGVKG